MIRKTAAVICAAALVFTFSTSALAEGSGNGGNDSSGGTVQASGSEQAQGSGSVSQVRGQMSQVRENNIQVRLQNIENTELREQLRSMLCQIDQSGEPLPEQTLNQLTALQEQLRAQQRLLAGTLGDIEDAMHAFRTSRLNRNYGEMSQDMETVMQVQQNRLQIKEQINAILRQMIDLAGE